MGTTDPKDARKASLKDAMDGTETDVPLQSAKTVVAEVAPAAPALSPDVLALMQTLANALTSNQTTQAEAFQSMMAQMAATMAEQTRLAREPIPENKVAPGVSAFNPKGDRDFPRPDLKCPVFLGQYDDDGKIEAAYPVLEDTSTVEELTLCNQLEQGDALIERNDGEIGKVVIQARRDGSGKLNRLVIAFPYGWMSKEKQAGIPPFKKILRAIVEQQPQTAAA